MLLEGSNLALCWGWPTSTVSWEETFGNAVTQRMSSVSAPIIWWRVTFTVSLCYWLNVVKVNWIWFFYQKLTEYTFCRRRFRHFHHLLLVGNFETLHGWNTFHYVFNQLDNGKTAMSIDVSITTSMTCNKGNQLQSNQWQLEQCSHATYVATILLRRSSRKANFKSGKYQTVGSLLASRSQSIVLLFADLYEIKMIQSGCKPFPVSL